MHRHCVWRYKIVDKADVRRQIKIGLLHNIHLSAILASVALYVIDHITGHLWRCGLCGGRSFASESKALSQANTT
jgi:hypothetical protein